MPILLTLILFPLLELALLIKVGSAIGAIATLSLVILSGIIGILLMRLAGLPMALQARERIARGGLPEREMLQGLVMFIGGMLLFIPGLTSDFLGLLILFPPARQCLLRILFRRLEAHVRKQESEFFSQAARDMGAARREQQASQIIEGEWQRKDKG